MFAHESTRQFQDKLLDAARKAVLEGKCLLAHAPTGLGKTAAVLAPAMEYALEKKFSVFFLTSRHTQHKIVLDTVEKACKLHNKDLHAVSILGKSALCPLNAGSQTIEMCKIMKEEGTCEFYEKFKEKGVSSGLFGRVSVSASDLINDCEVMKTCPYETAIALCQDADIIVCDYNYIFNPFIRTGFLKRIKKSLDNSIVVVDEAHNLPDRLREMFSCSVSTRTMFRAVKEAKKFGLDEALNWIVELQDVLNTLVPEKEERLLSKDNIKFDFDQAIADLADAADEVIAKQKRSYIHHIANFLFAWTSDDKNSARISVKDGDNIEFSVFGLDASAFSSPVADEAHAVLGVSGTLSPVSAFREVLGFPDDTILLEVPSPFPSKNRLVAVCPSVTSQYAQRSDAMFARIAECIEKTIKEVPGNVIVFFPSYFFMKDVLKLFRCERKVLVESQLMDRSDREDLLREFRMVENSVLFAVSSGSFGEGVDLPGIVKSVIVVGLPFQRPDLRSQQLVNFIDSKLGKGMEYGYVMPALVKCLQNAGRCIRSEKDKGALIFLDSRYLLSQYKKFFPKEWDVKIDREPWGLVKEFFQQ